MALRSRLRSRSQRAEKCIQSCDRSAKFLGRTACLCDRGTSVHAYTYTRKQKHCMHEIRTFPTPPSKLRAPRARNRKQSSGLRESALTGTWVHQFRDRDSPFRCSILCSALMYWVGSLSGAGEGLTPCVLRRTPTRCAQCVRRIYTIHTGGYFHRIRKVCRLGVLTVGFPVLLYISRPWPPDAFTSCIRLTRSPAKPCETRRPFQSFFYTRK